MYGEKRSITRAEYSGCIPSTSFSCNEQRLRLRGRFPDRDSHCFTTSNILGPRKTGCEASTAKDVQREGVLSAADRHLLQTWVKETGAAFLLKSENLCGSAPVVVSLNEKRKVEVCCFSSSECWNISVRSSRGKSLICVCI